MNKIFNKINKTDTCWNWIGEINENGYGKITVRGKRYMAHRYVYRQLVGVIPDGLDLDHLCRNRKCVNPIHLEPITHRENIKRAWKERIKNTPNCPRGHSFSGTNLYISFRKRLGIVQKSRECRICRRNNNKRWRKKIKNN